MPKFIKHIEAIGIHGRFDMALSFQDGINIVYGRNGAGKTTLLHILANAVNQDFRRFGYLKFRSLDIKLDDDQSIHIEQNWKENPNNTETIARINNDKEPVDFYRFEQLKEEEIHEAFFRENSIERKKISSKIDLEVTYFPAFRTMIEAWATLNEREITNVAQRSSLLRRRLAQRSARSTELARTLFGDFVPALNYPSPLEIQEQINAELVDVQLKVASSDRDVLSDAFVNAFTAISQGAEIPEIAEAPEEILKSIEELSERLQNLPLQVGADEVNTVYARLREQLKSFQLDPGSQNIAKRVLYVYKTSLQKRLDEQTSAYSKIETYLHSVNEFLERKKLVIQPRSKVTRPKLGVKIGEEKFNYSLQTLSSGERQIVGLIYAASYMTNGRVVLIDEPEISLHIDWQRKLLSEMVKQLGDKQLIVCTHSPVVASKYRNRMIELRLERTSDTSVIENLEPLEYEIDDIPF